MMRIGKLDNCELERLVLNKFGRSRPESFYTPGVGQDCAVLDLDGDLAVLSTDPITSAGISYLGRLTVHVSCNDAAAAGAEPVALLVTLLMPPSGSKAEIGRIADDLAAAARDAGVDIIGGHTEVTDAVTRPVTNACVIARAAKTAVLTGMRPGNDIVLTKWTGLEGTAIIAADCADRLRALPEEWVTKAAGFTKYLSVVPESRIAIKHGATEMHDVTEGGALGAAWEMACAAGCGVVLDTAAIPVLPETAAICKALSIDPLRLIGSGSMLIACLDGKEMTSALNEAGIPAVIVGKAAAKGVVDRDGAPIPPPGADELYKLF